MMLTIGMVVKRGLQVWIIARRGLQGIRDRMLLLNLVLSKAGGFVLQLLLLVRILLILELIVRGHAC